MFGSYEVKSSVCEYLLFLTLEKNLGGYKFKGSQGKTLETQWMVLLDTRMEKFFSR